MEKLISNWCNTVKSLPQEYVFPEDTRPGDKIVPNFENCPIIDLEKAISEDRNDIIQQILQASQDCGLFQVCMTILYWFFDLCTCIVMITLCC